MTDKLEAANNGETDKDKSEGTPVPVDGTIKIHFLDVGENLPAQSRIKDHFYIRAVSVTDAQIASGLPRTIKVSPNMQLKMVSD